MSKPDSYLVIGGSGFLGNHIVQALLARGELNVAVFDLVQRHHDPRVQFYTGDICEESQIGDAIRKSNITCIIHTASPIHNLKAEIYWRVNVDGTKAIIAAAQAHGVKKLVYTSSAGVVYNGADLIDVDERLPYPEVAMDAYNETKAKAEEIVLAANGQGGLLTVALRPAGIFGPGDRQVMHGLVQVFKNKQTNFQIGDNNNLFDWTYVGNVAKAHLLAADKLVPPPEKIDREEITTRSLASIDLTTGSYRIPTSKARPLGPAVTPVPDADKIEAAFRLPKEAEQRPVLRTRFDPMADSALDKEPVNPLQVAGQAFFITNGEPMFFWDFPRVVWKALGQQPGGMLIKLPKEVGLVLATAAEWWSWLVGKEPGFTRYRVAYSCASRWYNIEKARRVLGYEPDVGIEEGVKLMVDWYLEQNPDLKV